MGRGGEAGDLRGQDDVLLRLRAATAGDHDDVERLLGLLDPALTRDRLAEVVGRLHAFWVTAEAGLDHWAAATPADAAALDWAGRRRAPLFAADLLTLKTTPAADVPLLPPVPDTDRALGRLYVLEGSTLGGVVIDRHLASLPELAGVRIRALSPYGGDTGARWADFRRATRERVATGGDAEAIVGSARDTFRALAAWCRPVAASQPPT